jgi:hypothetical protein
VYYDPFDFDIDDDPYLTWKRLTASVRGWAALPVTTRQC